MTFDSAADLYQRARPDYPEPLYDALVTATGLRAGARVLEIGCGSAEPRALSGSRGDRRVLRDLRPVDRSTLRPRVRGHGLALARPGGPVRAGWQLLSPGGHLAFWSASHVFPEGGDPIFTELNAVYDEIGDGAPLGSVQPPPGELPDVVEQIERSGLFDLVLVRQFAWEIAYDADAYLGLLDTFSAHIAMQPWQRDRLYSEIRCRLEEREDGLLRRGWGAVLHVARRRDGA